MNLLRVFDAVIRHRSVSVASKELSVTASAISHALGRLRKTIGDELFIYGENGMEPTPRAVQLAPDIRLGLKLIEDAVSSKPFVPSESTRTFRISASDYMTICMLTGLVAQLRRIAPRISLYIFPCNRTDVVRHLDDGRIDFIVGWFGNLPDRMRRTSLMTETEALVVRPGHPLAAEKITRERLLAFPFAVTEFTGSEEQGVDGFFDDRGVWRRIWMERLLLESKGEHSEEAGPHVAVTLPHFAAIPHILRETDMVATLPERLARQAVARGELVMLDLPYEPLKVPVEAVWHSRGDRDPGLNWLLETLIELMQAA
ncbi:MAG TPA: LysR family transcriptional regulator [Enterovirga sp.]|nr:LysR family transcriptional regulator [Enterovirga sp.]